MNVNQKKGSLLSLSAELLVLVVGKNDLGSSRGKGRQGRATRGVDIEKIGAHCNVDLRGLIQAEGFGGKLGELLTFWGGDDSPALALVGWDGSHTHKKNQRDVLKRTEAFRSSGHKIGKVAERWGVEQVAVEAPGLELHERANLQALLEGIELSRYRFTAYKTAKESEKEQRRKRVARRVTVVSAKSIERGLATRVRAFSEGTALARDLVNMPAADCTPRFLVKQARKIALNSPIQARIYDEKKLKQIGANLLLSVGNGSREPSALIRLTYKPRRPKKVVSIVGKGITFDTGGYSIKTRGGMEGMKCDMAGAAAVLGTMHALRVLRPDVEVRGYVPTAENMIDGKATRPGDVVKGLSGKTVEILNTDAEGRLILADALALAEKEGCDEMIDLATLTGACMVSLGTSYAGLFSSDDALAEGILRAGADAGERFWRLPLADEYRNDIKSKVADIKNMGGAYGGAITAALFLQEFVKTTPWAHLDIAGPAFPDSAKGYLPAGGIGFGVRTLLNYLGV